MCVCHDTSKCKTTVHVMRTKATFIPPLLLSLLRSTLSGDLGFNSCLSIVIIFFFLLESFNWYVIGFQNLYTFVLLYIKKSEIKRSTLLIWLFHQKNVVLASYNSLSSTFMKFLWVNWTTKRRKKMWIFKCVRNFFELWLQK